MESIWDPLPLQVVVEVAVEPSEVAECGGGCVLFPPSSSLNLDFSEAAAASSSYSYCCSIYQYYCSSVNSIQSLSLKFQVPSSKSNQESNLYLFMGRKLPLNF